MTSNLKATIIAFAVAAAVFAFALQWRPWIILAGVVVLMWVGGRWLYRNHPLAFVILVAFMRGLLSGR